VVDVLSRIGAAQPVLTLFNKADQMRIMPEHLLREYPDSMFLSAKTGFGLAALREALRQKLFA
jgi:50S ribosomal subunit-associated GTPase HflX